ncbi:hypothetical protein [Microbacterium aurantiacum]|uniref:ElaB/YqjD/DUF883 family membrane-anchored ribosome-binding protein n=1 Tax=Microbacterium aurantiacum TaxID=162393 RepID=A0A0M8MM35_9MICO|nr:hypothetical protein [Microbacterium chocolatum]ANG85052.1 hypothetical protein A8L33_06350 [Microbacterium chocolatum]KOS10234.1 hypothetical protein XI38_12140 [Microbacterium chocolatum]
MTNADNTIDTAKDNIRKAARDAAASTESFGDDMADAGAKVADRISDAADALKGKNDTVDTVIDKATGFVKDHPTLTKVIGAVAIAVVASGIARRMSR